MISLRLYNFKIKSQGFSSCEEKHTQKLKGRGVNYAKNKDDRVIDTASNTSNFNNLCHSEQVAPKSFMNECAGSTFFAVAYSPEEQLLTVELVSQNK